MTGMIRMVQQPLDFSSSSSSSSSSASASEAAPSFAGSVAKMMQQRGQCETYDEMNKWSNGTKCKAGL